MKTVINYRNYPSFLGMSPRDLSRCSILAGLQALINPTSRGSDIEVGPIFEASAAIAKRIGRQPRGFFVPHELFYRDLTVGSDPGGGYLVPTDHRGDMYIDYFRNALVCRRAGATILDGLVGDVAIPKLTGGGSAYWVNEGGAVTESAQTFGQLALAPKTVGAFTDVSRKMLIQARPAAETVVKQDLLRAIAVEIDRVALHGSGVNPQPLGLANWPGIGAVIGGTNGKSIAYSHIIGLETEVAQDNADAGATAYIVNTKTRAKLRQVFTNATYGERAIWQDDTAQPDRGRVNGYPAYVSNNVRADLTKGNASTCSAVFFGNWADMVIGVWDGIDITVDPYSNSTTGTVRVVVMQDVDVGVRHAESFAVMLDALTA